MSHALELQIKYLEAQLSALKAKLAASKEEGSGKQLRDLCGILKGKADSTEEDIASARLCFPSEIKENN